MFCYQCQETKKNTGCNISGVCGKTPEVALLQDVLLQTAKEVAYYAKKTNEKQGIVNFLLESLFVTVTNVNFDEKSIKKYIVRGADICAKFRKNNILSNKLSIESVKIPEELFAFGNKCSVLSEKDEDLRSLKELLTYGLKGAAAYAWHAYVLGFDDESFNEFVIETLAYLFEENFDKNNLLAKVLECGKQACSVMALLDKANTETFGNQTPVKVSTAMKKGKSIIVSGHDLLDLYELLIQTEDKDINIYTHCEMLPAHAYQKLKQFKHLVGHFGTAWYNQQKEFEKFPGTILFTTNCIQKPLQSYVDRIFTTGAVGFNGLTHIGEREKGKMKDFSPLIEAALHCLPTEERDGQSYLIGFAKDTVMSVSDKVIEGVKSGAITKFVVMAGCDGRAKERKYFTDFAAKLPNSTIILTAGCAKYRYNHLDFGYINGIPRLLDAGQCNDSYSIAYIALQLQKAFGLDDINKLPVAFNIGWYEQKAVAVLLALLYLGFKNITLGPTLPGFLSPNIGEFLVSNFGIKQIGNVDDDLKNII